MFTFDYIINHTIITYTMAVTGIINLDVLTFQQKKSVAELSKYYKHSNKIEFSREYRKYLSVHRFTPIIESDFLTIVSSNSFAVACEMAMSGYKRYKKYSKINTPIKRLAES